MRNVLLLLSLLRLLRLLRGLPVLCRMSIMLLLSTVLHDVLFLLHVSVLRLLSGLLRLLWLLRGLSVLCRMSILRWMSTVLPRVLRYNSLRSPSEANIGGGARFNRR